MKTILFHILLVLLLLFTLYQTNWRLKDVVLEWQYRLSTGDEAVRSAETAKAIYQQLEKISYADLEEAYLKKTLSNKTAYRKLVEPLEFVRIKRADLYQKVAGNFRLKDFLCKDQFYIDCILGKRADIVATLNQKIFIKTIALQAVLEREGHDWEGFSIVNGHRHPAYNERVGGAKLSRHIKGEAVDIFIHDINQDGLSTPADKAIVLDILEKEVIGNEGGIGLYPGTGNVHYDVRGTRARWDSY